MSQKETEKNFGRSLLADYSDHYMSDFVLHGTSEKNIQEKLVKDLQMSIQVSFWWSAILTKNKKILITLGRVFFFSSVL